VDRFGVCDFAPAAVDGEGLSTILDLDNLADAPVVLLLSVGGGRDRRRGGDDQQWAASRGSSVSTFASVPGLRFAKRLIDSNSPRDPYLLRSQQRSTTATSTTPRVSTLRASVLYVTTSNAASDS
jgi:hypothetical protein